MACSSPGGIRRVFNPPNPWQSTYQEWLVPPPPVTLEVYEEEARSILSENESPDVGFRYSVNPYRGCFHGCAYCYARPTHEYLDFGAGTDFERKLVVKINAPQLLRKEIVRLNPKRDTLVFSGVTDPYQPLEASYALTRACLKVCLEYGASVGIVTKGVLIRRDVEILAQLAKTSGCQVYISLPFLNREHARAFEPYAPLPEERLETLRILSAQGISVGVAVAPVIPGINDTEIPEILRRAREAGARRAFMTLLRLPGSVRPVFLRRLKEAFPLRYEKVVRTLERMRGGRLYNPQFFRRMEGEGNEWDALRKLFVLMKKRYGYEDGDDPEEEPALAYELAPPQDQQPKQLALFHEP